MSEVVKTRPNTGKYMQRLLTIVSSDWLLTSADTKRQVPAAWGINAFLGCKRAFFKVR